jgi:hypothetical protein
MVGEGDRNDRMNARHAVQNAAIDVHEGAFPLRDYAAASLVA